MGGGRSRGASRRPPPGPEERVDRRTRALEEPLEIRRLAGAYPRFEVRNPIRRTRYVVRLPRFPDRMAATCECPDFARRGLGTCKHIEAAVRELLAAPGAETAPEASTPRGGAPQVGPSPGERISARTLWHRIDRRRREAGSLAGPPAVRLRRPGDTLIEDLPEEEAAVFPGAGPPAGAGGEGTGSLAVEGRRTGPGA
ncbi:MAG: SWIM zinc finger family protein [Thermoplasmata archaeon]